MRKTTIIAIAVLAIAIIGAAVVVIARRHGATVRTPSSAEPSRNAQTSAPPQTKPKQLPSGAETYRISQKDKLPRIVQATIDPPDVHVGDAQKLQVIVQDPDATVSFVEAQIETDHGRKTLLLGLVGPVAEAEVAPLPWTIDTNGHLVFGGKKHAPRVAIAPAAHAAEAPMLRYETSWTVTDTHDAKYQTTFIAQDAAGNRNAITLAWSDACAIPNGGDWNLATNNGGNCTISSTDGVDNGSATIATYTLTLNAPFVWNSGKSITITSGAIAVGSGGQLTKTNLWKQDADDDGYPNATQVAQDTQPTGYTRRYLYGSNANDCYDSNANAHPGQTAYFSTDRGDGSYDYDCDGNESKEFGVLAACGAYPSCAGAPGWANFVPGCGAGDTYALSYSCSASGSQCVHTGGALTGRTQTCQ